MKALAREKRRVNSPKNNKVTKRRGEKTKGPDQEKEEKRENDEKKASVEEKRCLSASPVFHVSPSSIANNTIQTPQILIEKKKLI